ncbi:MAG: four helix bundle protein [FCB group bacterium]|jgi:four helix bundle protein
MDSIELKNRTKKFGLRIINLVNKLQTEPTCKVISNQILRSGTSIGANYRAACRAKSDIDFINKIKICF